MFRIAIALPFASLIILASGVFAETETQKPLTSNHRQLTSGEWMKGYADWSPDGKFILFSSYEGKKQGEDCELWRIPAIGGEPVQITHSTGHHGAYSPDGKYIAYDGNSGTVVRVMPSDGGVPIRVVPESIPVNMSSNPCWSPDCTKIAFRAVEDYYILDLASGELTKIASRKGEIPMPIQWSKTGDCILTAFLIPKERTGDLWKVPVDGGNAEQITFSKSYINQGSISPDGKYIAFSSPIDGDGSDIYIMSWDGGKPLQLTDDPGESVEACWSPDGKRIVYMSRKSGCPDLWVMDVDMAEIEKRLNELNR